MTAYYNDNDRFAAAWLRELIRAKLIAPGHVDERSIEEVRPADLRGFTQCHFFAGIGGWAYAFRLAGWPDSRPVWSGSCPCQPFSHLGEQEGQSDNRHLWPTWQNLIRECKPPTIFGEQVSGAVTYGWFDVVATDMEALGYAVAAANLPACSRGAPHLRERLWFVGHAGGEGLEGHARHGENGRPALAHGSIAAANSQWAEVDWVECPDGKSRAVKPGVFMLAHGIPARVERLRGFGNSIVPQVAAAFIEAFMLCR